MCSGFAPISCRSTCCSVGAGGSIWPFPENTALVFPLSIPSPTEALNLFHLSSSEGAPSPLTEFPTIQNVIVPSSSVGAVHSKFHVLQPPCYLARCEWALLSLSQFCTYGESPGIAARHRPSLQTLYDEVSASGPPIICRSKDDCLFRRYGRPSNITVIELSGSSAWQVQPAIATSSSPTCWPPIPGAGLRQIQSGPCT